MLLSLPADSAHSMKERQLSPPKAFIPGKKKTKKGNKNKKANLLAYSRLLGYSSFNVDPLLNIPRKKKTKKGNKNKKANILPYSRLLEYSAFNVDPSQILSERIKIYIWWKPRGNPNSKKNK